VPTHKDIEDYRLYIANDVYMMLRVIRGDSTMQLQAFAAPETSGIWDEVRAELATEVARVGGYSTEAHGPFGTELHAHIGREGEPKERLEPQRFIGVDGPRWFLRGVLNGPAATNLKLARPFEEVFADVVVIRGEHSAPLRELLVIRLPEVIAVLEEQDKLGNHFGRPEGLASWIW
jgi:hypothetical protein